MSVRSTPFVPVKLSLADLVGEEYVRAVSTAHGALATTTLGVSRAADARRMAHVKVEFFPKSFQNGMQALLRRVGTSVAPALAHSAEGAGSEAFHSAENRAAAPIVGAGFFRVGEDGRLFFISKSEHYHSSLGHRFPGYQLVERARALGIPNATHNNTRGHITRLLEEELVRTAAGLAAGDEVGLARVRKSRRPDVVNRVLNLETGSLAAEAALKLALARFHAPQPAPATPKYADRVPVVLVMADDEGGPTANYHGTTVLTQVMRGMWSGLARRFERGGGLLVRAVRPNSIEALETAFMRYSQGRYQIAAFFHELVMMNYGARRLDRRFVRRAYALCRAHDVPTVVDEIQTGVWAPGLYLFREYGVKPSMVVLGKGFPGGEYPASRILFSAAFDALPQFGALVTNGQEELASLAYLVTMRWAEANAEVIAGVGDYIEERLHDLAEAHPRYIRAIEGRRHLAGLAFHDLGPAQAFTRCLNAAGLDISVQSYKDQCPPCALLKLPLIAGYGVVDWLVERMDQALRL